MAKGKSVLDHPDKLIIDKMLLTGWTTTKIHNWLASCDKQPVSVVTLNHYLRNYIDPKLVLPPSIYDMKINQLDIQFDSLQELYNLMEIQKRRIGPYLTMEAKNKMPMLETLDELKLLRDTIVKALQLEMELGIRTKAPVEIIDNRIDVLQLLIEYNKAKKEQEALAKVIEP